MKPIRLMSGVLTVGGWTMVSRLLGFLRDVLIAVMLGSGPVAEAFLVAFSLPNMFRRFFAEGAFNMAFVPMFSKRLETDDDPKGFASQAFSGLFVVLVVFSLVAIIAMPLLVSGMASGFRGDIRFELAVGFGRICFIYILFISLAALLSGVLNALGHFAVAAAAPVLLNIILVSSLLLGDTGWVDLMLDVPNAAEIPGLQHGTLLAWGVVLAGIAQLALLVYAATRAGFRPRLQRPKLTPEMKRLVIVATPAVLAGGVVQINLIVGRQVASFFEGAVAWLAYADRLYQLPLGVVGIAVGIVLLPDLSRRLSAGDAVGGREALSRAGEIALALTIPAAIALMVIPDVLVGVLFQRGQFGADDTARTALAVAVYGIGLPAFVLQKVLQPLFFAREDTRSPFRFAVWAMLTNAVCAIGLAPIIGWIASALATSLAGWVMVFLLWRGSRRLGEVASFDARFTQRIRWQIVSALFMGVVLWICASLLDDMLGLRGWRFLALAMLVAAGMASYFAAAHLTGGLPLGELKQALRRNRRAKG